jgi:beta-xylosidase
MIPNVVVETRPNLIWPWRADQQDGTYCNPILCADYSDPDVIRRGDDFYLTASSFNCTPGLPILHSRDLVNWTIINHALKNLPDPRYAEVQHGCGVWAPAIRFHARKFWIFFPTPDEGIYVTTADHPTSQWSEPHLVQAGKGLIDPCPLWDDDGQAYLVHAYAGSRAGIKHLLRVRPMAPDGSRLLGEGQIVFNDPLRHPTLEGPKFLKRNGWYYISAPAGGVESGWQVILRSRHVYGPYKDKTVLAQRDTPINGPHQGALVDTPAGDWWFVHFQDVGVYGRIVHLQPARWENDWPLLGVDQDGRGVGCPVQNHPKPDCAGGNGVVMPQTSDCFDGPRLGLQWQWHANHKDAWYSLSERPGHLRLYPQYVVDTDFSKAGNLLLQKLPARQFSAETEVELPSGQPHVHAGLIVMGEEYCAIDANRSSVGYALRVRTKNGSSSDFVVNVPTLRLCVTIGEGGVCRFGTVCPDGSIKFLGPAFQARPGRWMGAKVGLYCVTTIAQQSEGYADFAGFKLGRPL